MKVLQINSVCGIGSTGRIATDIHAILRELGHDSYLAFGREEAINCDSALRIGNKYDNYLHVIKTRVFDKHGFGSKRATKEFVEKLKELDPDVIHLHNIHGYYINIEILFEYLKKVNKPVIWTLHDCWAFTGHCTNFEYSGCECWKIESDHFCIQKKSYPTSIICNNSKNNYKRKKRAFSGLENMTIVTPSDWLASYVKQSFLGSYPIHVINNGIDLGVFQYTKSSFKEKHNLENKYIILGVANIWNQRKGLDYFKELSSKLQEDEVIVLVGLSEKQLKHLPSNILGISRTNDINELAEVYSAADVFVNLTLEEVMGLVNVEALACGTPVITFKTGGTIETIDNKCSFWVEQGDLNQLIDKIILVRSKGKNYYFDKCIERASLFYNKNDRFKDYINLYKKVVGLI